MLPYQNHCLVRSNFSFFGGLQPPQAPPVFGHTTAKTLHCAPPPGDQKEGWLSGAVTVDFLLNTNKTCFHSTQRAVIVELDLEHSMKY